MELEDRERTPARTPWWLTLIRLAPRRARHPGARRADPPPGPEADGRQRAAPRRPRQRLGHRARFRRARRRRRDGDRRGRARRPPGLLRRHRRAARGKPRGRRPRTRPSGASRRSCRGPTFPTAPALAARLAEAFGERSVEVVWVAGAVDGGDGAAFAAALNRIAVARQRAPVGAPGDRDADAGEPRRRRARAGRPLRRSGRRSGSPASTRRAGASSKARRRSTAAAPARPRSRCRRRSATRSSASA